VRLTWAINSGQQRLKSQCHRRWRQQSLCLDRSNLTLPRYLRSVSSLSLFHNHASFREQLSLWRPHDVIRQHRS